MIEKIRQIIQHIRWVRESQRFKKNRLKKVVARISTTINY